MRVIITTPSLDPDLNISGISSLVSFIISHNLSIDYTAFILGKKDGETRGFRWLMTLLNRYAKWVFLMCHGRHSLIHFNFAMTRRGVLRDVPLILVARLFRRHIVAHIHGGEFMTAYEMPRWMGYLVRTGLGRGPMVVLSERERIAISRTVPRAKVVVLSNCIDLEEARLFERAAAEDRGLRILFLGRIAEDKGLQAIFEALKALRTGGTQVRFIMAGTGPDEKQYVNQFRELLGSDFDFVGRVTGSAKTLLLKSCNVFILPSIFEGLPMALLESMAFGLVPITTSVGSIPDIVEDGRNGIIVNRNAPEEIVHALKKLDADSEYRWALAKNARQRIVERCDPQQYVSQLNAVYSYDEHDEHTYVSCSK